MKLCAFARAVQQMGVGEIIGREEVELVFLALDQDGSGDITYKEYL